MIVIVQGRVRAGLQIRLHVTFPSASTIDRDNTSLYSFEVL